MSDSVFDWHKAHLLKLLQHYNAGKLAHALLLSGEPGTGKIDFARILANALLCISPDHNNRPCGNCDSCILFTASTHPDYLEIVPDDDSQNIKIDQTRQLPKFLGLTRHLGAERVIIIYPAETMNKFSMNALLKTLEEPPSNTFILVVSHNPALLLATIRSRCVHTKLDSPTTQQTLEWLGLTAPNVNEIALIQSVGNKPKLLRQLIEANLADIAQEWFTQWLAVAAGAESAVKVAGAWQKQDISHILFMLHSWIADLIKIMLTKSTGIHIDGRNVEALAIIAPKLEITQVYDYYTKIIVATRLMARSVNQQLLLESLLLDWQQLFTKRAVHGY